MKSGKNSKVVGIGITKNQNREALIIFTLLKIMDSIENNTFTKKMLTII